MRTRIHTVALCLLFMAPLSASTSEADQRYQPVFKRPFPELLSYEEMAQLRPYQRIAYLQQLRELLVEVSNRTDGRRTAEVDSLKTELNALLKMMDPWPAAAAKPAIVRAQAQPQAAYILPAYPALNTNQPRCSNSTVANFIAPLGTCAIQPDAGGICGKGSKMAHLKSSSGVAKYCVPDDSWFALTPERRVELANATGADPMASSHLAPNRQVEHALSGLPADQRNPVANGRIPDKLPSIDQAKMDDRFYGSKAPMAMRQSKSRDANDDDDKKHGTVVECRKLLKSGYDREKHRADWGKQKGDGADACVSGGFFSAYKTPEKKAGDCKAVSVFPPAAAGSKAGDGAISIKCPDPNASMCNPMLFCGAVDKSKKFTPICLRYSQNLTKACYERTPKDCDPFSEKYKDIPALRNEWGEYQKKFAGLCTKDSSFASFFCQECDYMGQRIREMNGGLKNPGTRPAAPAGATPPETST